jgi:ferric-dicitrate binding protein FerR (iron transport regulator)
MQLLHGRNRAAIRTAWRALRAYGALKHFQGRRSAKRSPRSRVALLVAGGAGLVAGVTLGQRPMAGCCDDHDHGHDHSNAPAV